MLSGADKTLDNGFLQVGDFRYNLNFMRYFIVISLRPQDLIMEYSFVDDLKTLYLKSYDPFEPVAPSVLISRGG
jgi:hypothetical protein